MLLVVDKLVVEVEGMCAPELWEEGMSVAGTLVGDTWAANKFWLLQLLPYRCHSLAIHQDENQDRTTDKRGRGSCIKATNCQKI